MNCGMFVVRVPSKENLADDPSRERYGLLAGMKVSFWQASSAAHVIICAPMFAGEEGGASARSSLLRRAGLVISSGDGAPPTCARSCVNRHCLMSASATLVVTHCVDRVCWEKSDIIH